MNINKNSISTLLRIFVCVFLGISIPVSCIPFDLLDDIITNLDGENGDDSDGSENTDGTEEGENNGEGENSGEGENNESGSGEGEGSGSGDGDGENGEGWEPVTKPTTLEGMKAALPQAYIEFRSFDEDGYDEELGDISSNGTGWTPDGSYISWGGYYSNSVLRFTMGNNYHELIDFDNVGLGFFKTETAEGTTQEEVLESTGSVLRANFNAMGDLWDVLNKYRNHYDLLGPTELKVVGKEQLLGREVTHYKGDKANGGAQEYWVLENGDCLKYKYTTVYTWTDPATVEVDGVEITHWDENVTNGYELFGAALNKNAAGGQTAYESIPVEKLTRYTDEWDKSLYPSVTDHEWKDLSYVGLGVDDLIPPYTGSGTIVAMNVESDHGHSFFGSVHTIEAVVTGATKEDVQEYANTIAQIKYARSLGNHEYEGVIHYEYESSACDSDNCPSNHDPDFGPSHEIGYEVEWRESPLTAFMEDHANNSYVKLPQDTPAAVIKIWLIQLGCWY